VAAGTDRDTGSPFRWHSTPTWARANRGAGRHAKNDAAVGSNVGSNPGDRPRRAATPAPFRKPISNLCDPLRPRRRGAGPPSQGGDCLFEAARVSQRVRMRCVSAVRACPAPSFDSYAEIRRAMMGRARSLCATRSWRWSTAAVQQLAGGRPQSAWIYGVTALPIASLTSRPT
jgi:hypothetical protein